MTRIHKLFFFLQFLIIHAVCGQNLPVTSYKYRITSSVVNQVSLAFSDLRQAPKLIMPGGKSNQIARLTLEPEIQLIVDEKLYDLCREIGKDSLSALAFIISHELTHFFYRHQHPFGFAMPQNSLMLRNRELEKEADLYGLINAFAAGYQSFAVASRILDKIYQTYQLPDSLQGYPTRKERLHSIVSYTKQARQLAFTHEVGKFLYFKRDFASAEHCFSNLASQIPSAEFLNNLGLAKLQQALAQGWSIIPAMPFKLPVELDAESRLMGIDRRDPKDENKTESQAQMESAVKNFEKAISINKSYQPAYLNLATTLLLLGKNGTAGEMLDQLRKNVTPFSTDAHLLAGIAFARKKEYVLAKAELGLAGGAYEIEFNRKVLSLISSGGEDAEMNQQIQKLVMTSQVPLAPVQLVDEKSLGAVTLPLTGSFLVDHQVFLPKPDLVHFQHSQINGLHTYKILLKEGTYQMIQGNSQHKGLLTSRGIKAGDGVHKLTSQYGAPNRIVQLAEGQEVYCYDKGKIYFKVQEGEVQNWLIYQKIAGAD